MRQDLFRNVFSVNEIYFENVLYDLYFLLRSSKGPYDGRNGKIPDPGGLQNVFQQDLYRHMRIVNIKSAKSKLQND